MFRRFIAVLVFALSATVAIAQETSATDELKQRIAELEQKVASLQQGGTAPAGEITEIKRQIEILSREIEALKIDQPSAPAETEARNRYAVGPAAAKVYGVEQGVSIGGYGEMLYEGFASQRDNGLASGSTDQLDFLRAVVYTGYKFSDRAVFNSEIEFEHAQAGEGKKGEVSVEFAYLDFMLNPAFNIRGGMVLIPMGLVNELHEPTAFLGAKRPVVENAIIPTTWRENGVGVWGDIGNISYRTYITTALHSGSFSNSGIRSGRQVGARASAEDLAFSGRVDWKPVEGILLGASAYTGDSSQNRKTPAGESFDANVRMFDVHAEARLRGLILRALWSDGRLSDAREVNLANNLTGSNSVGERFAGWYAEAGYDVAPLFDRGNFSLTPYVRYEQLDTQKEVPAGFTRKLSNDAELITAGVAWKPIPQAVIKFDYTDFERADDSGVDQFSLALGYIF